MKYIFRLLSLVLVNISCISLSAQIRLINLSLTKPDSALLYLGIDNKIKIMEYIGNSVSYITLSNKSKIYTNEDSIFYISPTKLNTDTLSVFSNNKKIFEKIFMVKLIPDFVVQLSTIKNNISTKEQIIAFPKLIMYMPNCLLKHMKCRILAYELNIINSKGISINSFTKNSEELDSEIIQIVKKLKTGDKLKFENIKGVFPDSRIRNFGSYEVTIL